MNGPITNFEFGKLQHRDYEAQASRSWGRDKFSDNTSSFLTKTKLTLTLSGVGLTVLTTILAWTNFN